MVGAAAFLVQAVLIWLLDRPETISTSVHFDLVPAAIATGVVAGGVWAYHSSVAVHQVDAGGAEMPSARRAYRHLTAAVGLGTLVIGLVLLL